MKTALTRAETGLLIACILALVFACWAPSVAQYSHYHAFADQRTVLGLPFAMDVLSNLPFVLLGGWGLFRLHAVGAAGPTGASRSLAQLFFAGLVLTALCSTWYHLQPGDGGLAVDRLGMVVAFAGLLGLAAADRIGARAGVAVAVVVMLAGPLSVVVWATSGNLLPWSVLQGGGMLLVLLLANRSTVAGAWGMPLVAVIVWYALAKGLELGDHVVFAWTHGVVSGHTLKHLAAAMAAWPVIALMHNGAHARNRYEETL